MAYTSDVLDGSVTPNINDVLNGPAIPDTIDVLIRLVTPNTNGAFNGPVIPNT